MAFLDDLRGYLEHPETVFEPEVAAHRKHIVQSLKRLEEQGIPAQEVERIYDHQPAHLDLFLTTARAALLESVGKGEPDEVVFDLVNVALDRELGLRATTGSTVMDREIDRARQVAKDLAGRPEARHAYEAQVRVDRYALAVRAVKRRGASRMRTPIGQLVLDLPQRDALRWLLAVEATESLGWDDDLRLSRAAAANLLADPRGEQSLLREDETTPGPAWWRTMERLDKMGLISFYDTGRASMAYAVLDEGRPLLEEIASGQDTPFLLLARALLQDETSAVLDKARPQVLVGQAEGSATVVARHARMVAHEMRNALVPVKGAVDLLFRDAERQGLGSLIEGSRETIAGGLDRVFRFLRDISRIADFAAPSELFDLIPAVQDAIAVVAPELNRAVPLGAPATLPVVRGNRDRLVLAVVDILRNAAQSRAGAPVEIRVSAGTHNGAEVFLAVDDDGPGVPPEHRARIFEPGFSLRPGGTGQGLALVREVVETEMAGRAVCEESALGGARFVLRLPVGARRNG